MNNMDNGITLSEFQTTVAIDLPEVDRVVYLSGAADAFLADSILAETQNEFKTAVSDVIVSLANFCEASGYDIGDVSMGYGPLINGPALSTRDWAAANLGRLFLEVRGRGRRDDFNEKCALAGVVAGLAEMCHNNGIDLEGAAMEAING